MCGIERTDNLDIVADVVGLYGGERLRDPGVIVSTPAWTLPAANVDVGFRIYLLDRLSAHQQRIGERDVHPLFEIGPTRRNCLLCAAWPRALWAASPGPSW